MIEQLWEKYSEDIGGRERVWEVMHKGRFKQACTDLLSSQWQTREPTEEDGVEVVVDLGDGTYIIQEVLYWSTDIIKFKRWMSIPK